MVGAVYFPEISQFNQLYQWTLCSQFWKYKKYDLKKVIWNYLMF